MELIIFVLFISPMLTSAWPIPQTGQMVCFQVTDPSAKDIRLIYYDHEDESELFERKDTLLPLPNCTGSEDVELDSCHVCVREEQVIANCRLSKPSAVLKFEATLPLSRIQIVCDSTTTLTPPSTAAPTTAPPTAAGLSDGHVAGIIIGVLLAVALFAAGVIFREKIKTWMPRRRGQPVPKEDSETGMEMKGAAPDANGHLLLNGHVPENGAADPEV